MAEGEVITLLLRWGDRGAEMRSDFSRVTQAGAQTQAGWVQSRVLPSQLHLLKGLRPCARDRVQLPVTTLYPGAVISVST